MSNAIDNDLLDYSYLTHNECILITKARRRIEEANKSAFIKYRMLSIDEFRRILKHRRALISYKNGELGWQDQPAQNPSPLWLVSIVLDWELPLIYPNDMFD